MVAELPIMHVGTAGGHLARFAFREDTNDSALVSGIIGEPEYPFGEFQGLSGWAIDIGAHIGVVTVALALDNPDLRVVAVEALAENVGVLRDNVFLNGLADRVYVEHAAAGSEEENDSHGVVPIAFGWSRAQNQPEAYMHQSRYIGGMVGPNDSSISEMCRAISLGGIMAYHGISEVALLKIDCEGCEWWVLRSPAIARVRRITGEMHEGRHGTAADLRAMLSPTHDLTIAEGNVARFEAVRR